MILSAAGAPSELMGYLSGCVVTVDAVEYISGISLRASYLLVVTAAAPVPVP